MAAWCAGVWPALGGGCLQAGGPTASCGVCTWLTLCGCRHRWRTPSEPQLAAVHAAADVGPEADVQLDTVRHQCSSSGSLTKAGAHPANGAAAQALEPSQHMIRQATKRMSKDMHDLEAADGSWLDTGAGGWRQVCNSGHRGTQLTLCCPAGFKVQPNTSMQVCTKSHLYESILQPCAAQRPDTVSSAGSRGPCRTCGAGAPKRSDAGHVR